MQSLVDDTMRLVNTLHQMFPINSIRIERNAFDPQLMMNPEISGIEYQHGTLHGRQVRAYVMDRDNSRCVYCGTRDAKLELDHVRPRSIGSIALITSSPPASPATAKRPTDQSRNSSPASQSP